MPVNDDAESRYVKSPPVTKSKRFDTPLSDLKNVANTSLFTAKDKTDIITEKGVYTLHANKKQRCSLYHNDHFLPTNIANDLLSHVIKTKSHINQPDGSTNNNNNTMTDILHMVNDLCTSESIIEDQQPFDDIKVQYYPSGTCDIVISLN